MNVSQVRFYNPARTIECRFSFGAVACATFPGGRLAILNATIPAQIVKERRFGHVLPHCRIPGPSSEEPGCWLEPRGSGPVLPYGGSITDPRGDGAPGFAWRPTYRCTSSRRGIACWSIQSKLGFRITQMLVEKLRRS